MNSKRGSAIAEAAVVFPAVAVAVLAVVYILISLYLDASYAARDHLALRKESGVRTETVGKPDGYGSLAPEDKFGRKPFREQAEITEGMKFPDSLLLTDRGRVYIVDETGYIRKIDLLRGVREEM